MNYWKRFIGDYQRDTGHLSMVEHGAYTLMLDVHYATERPLPTDRRALYRLLRAIEETEQAAIDAVLDEFWTETEDGWVNGRAREEIAAANAVSDAARMRAHKRWRSNSSAVADANADADASKIDAHRDASHSHSHSQKPQPVQNPKTLNRCAPQKKRGTRPRQDSGTMATPVSQVWTPYAAGYRDRYGLDPPRNAKANALCKQLVERLGLDDAIAVAGWYPSHRGRWHVEKGHSLATLLADCEALRTQWATGRMVTSAEAREQDGHEKRGQVWQKLIEEADGDEPQTLSE